MIASLKPGKKQENWKRQETVFSNVAELATSGSGVWLMQIEKPYQLEKVTLMSDLL